MKIIDSYSKLFSSHSVKDAHSVFRSWEYSDSEIAQWFKRKASKNMHQTALLYLSEVKQIVAQVEDFFGEALPGELVLIPSMGEIDGFARYDRGHHTVMLGIDFPDASLGYLRALTAHELSHVYRDHCPRVWDFLKKPLRKIAREEYLEATSGREHLVSEGLATLTSQTIFPEIAQSTHHYYDDAEMLWCENHFKKIDQALKACLREKDPDPWEFYTPGVIGRGSPSRTHYFWAAKKIKDWLETHPEMSLLDAHGLPAIEVTAF